MEMNHLKPIVELGVAEAYVILVDHFGEDRIPPLEAVENEDWGRDLLLSRLADRSEAELAEIGLRLMVVDADHEQPSSPIRREER